MIYAALDGRSFYLSSLPLLCSRYAGSTERRLLWSQMSAMAVTARWSGNHDANNWAQIRLAQYFGPSRITPVSLPTIADPVVIDGATQPGFAGVPIIELAGKDSPSVGLNVNAPGCTIRGLVINTFRLGGIFIGTNGAGTHVEGCYIGTDITGMTAAQNDGPGISVLSSNNVIGGTTTAARNLISGNSGAGVQIELFCCTGSIGRQP